VRGSDRTARLYKIAFGTMAGKASPARTRSRGRLFAAVRV